MVHGAAALNKVNKKNNHGQSTMVYGLKEKD